MRHDIAHQNGKCNQGEAVNLTSVKSCNLEIEKIVRKLNEGLRDELIL